jgi:hypothetical protein
VPWFSKPILDSKLNFPGKSVCSPALHLVEMDTDPDGQALDADPDLPKMMPVRPDPDPHDTVFAVFSGHSGHREQPAERCGDRCESVPRPIGKSKVLLACPNPLFIERREFA